MTTNHNILQNRSATAKSMRRIALAIGLTLFVLTGQPRTTISQEKTGADHYNIYFSATEELANRIVRHTETVSKPVVDVILGARVRGESLSTASVSLDFKPNDASALAWFCLHTEIQSNTVSSSQNTLTNVLGRHTLLAAKPIFFDGTIVETQRPRAGVVPRNFTRGVRSPVTGVFLVGPTVDRIIFSEVEKRKPLSNRITASRVLNEAVPQFNSSIDKELGQLNGSLTQTVRPWLEQRRLFPDAQLACTTESCFIYRALLKPDDGTTVSALPRSAREEAAIVVAVHESLLNAAVDRQELGGKSFTDRALDRWVTKFTESLRGTEDANFQDPATSAPADDDKPQLATVRLDKDEPVRIRIADDRLTLTLKLGILPILGDEIPPQPISIPLHITTENGKILVAPGKVSVGGNAEDAAKVPELVRTLIRQQVESRLKSLTLDGRFSIPSGGSQPVSLSVTQITANDGWLVFKLN